MKQTSPRIVPVCNLHAAYIIGYYRGSRVFYSSVYHIVSQQEPSSQFWRFSQGLQIFVERRVHLKEKMEMQQKLWFDKPWQNARLYTPVGCGCQSGVVLLKEVCTVPVTCWGLNSAPTCTSCHRPGHQIYPALSPVPSLRNQKHPHRLSHWDE